MTDLWERVTAVHPAPTPDVVALTAAVAVALVVLPGVWPVARHAVTVAHEAGHAVVAAATGRRLSGIRLHSDTSGLTVSRGPRRGPGMVLMLAAGYPAPGLLGLGGAALVAHGRGPLLLWALLVALALMLLLIRNLFGLWVVLVGGAGVAAVTWAATPAVQTAAATALAWFWLLAAPRAVLELARRRGPASDADQLARLTRLPAALWVLLLLAATVTTAVAGGRLLVAAALAVGG